MPIRKILCLVGGRGQDDGVLDLAALLARRFDAHVDVLLVRPDPRDATLLFAEGLTGNVAERILEQIEKDAAQMEVRGRDAFDRWQARHRLPLADAAPGPGAASAGWRAETGSEADVLAQRGRLADLIVLGRATEDNRGPSMVTVEAALLDTGRPVVLAPPARPASPPRRVAIAWKGSAEASRAVALAMPFLHRADAVAVIAVDEAAGMAQGARDLADYLRWHDIRAQVEAVAPRGETGADILDTAARLQADLLVMGAYTRSRLRELVFGGATRHVLDHAGLPVLMAH